MRANSNKSVDLCWPEAPDAAVFRSGMQYAGLNTPAIRHHFHNKWELRTQGAWVCPEHKRGSRATGHNLEWAGDMK